MLRVEIVAILETILGKTFYAIPENYSEKKEGNILEYIDNENKVHEFHLYSYGGKGTSGYYPNFLKVYPVLSEPDIEDWIKVNHEAVEVKISGSELTLKGIPREKNIRWFCNAIVK